MSNFKDLTPFMPSLNARRVLEIASSASEFESTLRELGVAEYARLDSKQLESNSQKWIILVLLITKIKHFNFKLFLRYDFVILNLDLNGLSDDEFLSLCEASLKHLELNGNLFFTASSKNDSSKPQNRTIYKAIFSQ